MTAPTLRDCRILCVEDEYYLAVDLEHQLTKAGVVVLGPVPSVEQALTLIETEAAIDAAILDVNLGGEMSYGVADALMTRGIPFVFATGYTDGDLDARFSQLKRCIKPVDWRTLEQFLIDILPA